MSVRVKIPLNVAGPDGRPFEGASLTIRHVADDSTATVYAGRTGGSTISNPLESDAQGRVPGWVERGHYKAVVAPAGMLDGYTEYFQASPADDESIDSGWLSPAAILDVIMPVGIVVASLSPDEPGGGFLRKLNGQAISRAGHPAINAMAAAASYAQGWGPGDGSTTLNLPNWTDHVPIGAAGASINVALGAKTGVKEVTLTGAQSGTNGSGVVRLSRHFIGDGVLPGEFAFLDVGGNLGSSGAVNHDAPLTARNADTPHTNVQPSVGTHWLVRVK